MAEQNYIYEIFTKKLEKQIEQDFERDYPFTKATFTLNNPMFTQIVIRIFDRKLNYINTYIATEFDCKPAFEDDYGNTISTTKLDDADIRRWYLRWMGNNKNFPTYKTDFKKYINKVADEDLGIQQ